MPCVHILPRCSKDFCDAGRVETVMSKQRSRQAASPELQAAVHHLKRNGYAVGSPVMSLTGRAWVMVAGKFYWEEQAIEMAEGGSAIPEAKAPALPAS